MLRVLRRSVRRAQMLEHAIHAARPRGPHWYLATLGTDPGHQGCGVGSSLIDPVLRRADASALPAYLESSKEENIPFYQRHGFRVTQELTVPGGPTLWSMQRDPARAGA
jgi:ribosomal protein S18 acetylase RimI-like enzyme